ncbi:MAG: hypothetical protein GY802_21520, partial [Gammaproteobacteria bacterium]|nr:hypothetical protein [Gammaproteobacteria bacterium]
ALLASSPLLVDTVIDLGLPRQLRAASPLDANVRITTFANIAEVNFEDLNDELEAIVNGSFGAHIDRFVASVSSNYMFPWAGDTMLDTERVNLITYSDIENQVEIIAGSWVAAPSSEENVIPVVIGEAMAEHYALQVGSRLPLSIQSADPTPSVWLEITGIVRARTPKDPYWF